MMLKMLLMLLNMMPLVRELSQICINPEPKRNSMMPRKLELLKLEWSKFLMLERKLMKLKRKPDNLLLSKHTKLMSFMLKNTMLTLRLELLPKLLPIMPIGRVDMELKRDFH